MEKRFSKDDILVKYLNIINYGDGCYGIEAAAQNYFQVSALDLTLAQAATLVGIPQSPTYLNPKVYPGRLPWRAATWCSTACCRPATSRSRSTTMPKPRSWG